VVKEAVVEVAVEVNSEVVELVTNEVSKLVE
jgi:hypothetical protein